MQALTNDQLQKKAPSVFALEPWQERSDRYRFIPTINVIDALRDKGFYPVSAMQSRTRIEGKENFTKHLIRFRNSLENYQANDTLPEIVLINSHDGTSAYKLMFGLFRLVCSNGLVVADGQIDSISVRHTGDKDLRQSVIDASGEILNEAPKVLETVNRWEKIQLTYGEQTALAESALKINSTTLKLEARKLLYSRRFSDNGNQDSSRSLWKAFNVIQENLIKGGIIGVNNAGRGIRTREIKSIDANTSINKALWTLSAKMAEIKNAASQN